MNQPHLLTLIKNGRELPLATQNYPSRGQTAVQKLYQTSEGKLFYKEVSKINHTYCRINVDDGSLAEREYWAQQLAKALGLNVPDLWMINANTTIQRWLDYPDGRLYASSQGVMNLLPANIFDCALFDWLTGQVDRHNANYLYNYGKCEIILIDSAHCFLKYSGSLPDYLEKFEISQNRELHKWRESKLKDRLSKLTSAKLRKLVPLRNPLEAHALEFRLNELKTINSIHEIIQLYRESHHD